MSSSLLSLRVFLGLFTTAVLVAVSVSVPPAIATIGVADGSLSDDDAAYEAMMQAVHKSQHSVVLDFLSHGVDPNLIIDNLGLSPLSVACALGDVAMVELLLKYGADVHFHCTELNSLLGHSPIHHAAGRGHAEIVDLLIKNGADVNDKIPGRWSTSELNIMAGHTPIHLAAIEGNVKVLEVLIANGAEVNEPVTHKKFTPVDLAMIEESEAAVHLLKRAGGRSSGRLSDSDTDGGSLWALLLCLLVSTLPVGYIYYTGGFARRSKKKVPLKPKKM